MPFFSTFHPPNEGLSSKPRQLVNLLLMRERKEGQIRALKYTQRTTNNQISRELTELYTLQDQIRKLAEHIETIDEDIRSFL